MRFPIGSMSIGDILDRGIKLLFARLGTFYAIQLIVLTPLIIFQLALPMFGMAGAVEPTPAAAGGVLLGSLLALLLLVILTPIGTAATLHVIAQEYMDHKVGISEAFAFALRRFGSLLGAVILAGLIIVLGYFLCIVPGIIFSVWYVFVSQVVVVEGAGAGDALGRSKSLTDGYRWRIFGIVLLLGLIIVGGQFAAGILQMILPPAEMVPVERAQELRAEQPPRRVRGFDVDGPTHRQVFNYRNYAIDILVGQLIGILLQSFQSVCLTLLYFDTRIRKEGFDLEMLAQQTSRPDLEPPPMP